MKNYADRTTTGLGFLAAALLVPVGLPAKDPNLWTRHFQSRDERLEPWRFIPESNIASLNRDAIPGLLSLKLAGRGEDVKGLLPKPIRIDEIPTPWVFQLGMLQDQNAVSGMLGRSQINYAFGLNVALTFSDPADWPEDRSRRPPRTHDLQLLLVHLGGTGEVTTGLPQYTTDQHPERYLIWGRGDLGYSAMGDWKIPYVEIGNGMRDGGPASSRVFFQCRVDNPTTISVGVKFDSNHDYNMRTIDFAKIHGPATAIWEIGPVVSGDNWIPDTLCRVIPFGRGPQPITTGAREVNGKHLQEWIHIPQPIPEPPHPAVEYHIDYMAFSTFAGQKLESFSDEFDIPGFLDRGRFQLYASRLDTHTHPGYLTWTKSGRSLECFAWGTPGTINFKTFPPPWEIETSVIPPSDEWNWDFNFGVGLMNAEGKDLTYWYPGVRNLPVSGRREPYNWYAGTPQRPGIQLRFPDPEAIAKALSGKRVDFLIQFISEDKIRVGFRAGAPEAWTFSEPYDLADILPEPVDHLIFAAWNASLALPSAEEHRGFPDFQQYRFDYIRYRYGLTE